MDKSLILNKIKSHYKLKKDTEFAQFLGIKPQTLYTWYSRNTFDYEVLYTKCKDIDGNWLLSGEGEMLRRSVDVDSVSDYEEEIKGLQDQLIKALSQLSDLQHQLLSSRVPPNDLGEEEQESAE